MRDGDTAHGSIWRPGHRGVGGAGGECTSEDAGSLEPRTHLAAPLAGERRGARRLGNSPVWILGLFHHAFSPIKSRIRHMIIKKKISVPPLQTTTVEPLSGLPRGRAHIRGGVSPPWAYPIGRKNANLGSEAPFPAVIGPFGRQCQPTDFSVRSGLSKRRQ